MTHNEFKHILSSIQALSPDQMRQLVRELQTRMAAPATTDAGESAHDLASRAGPIGGIEDASRSPTAPAEKPIWEEILELTADVPEEEWAKLPTDLAEQHDHYIYGTPKRPVP